MKTKQQNKKRKDVGKFVGYMYLEKPSPHRVPVFQIDFDKEITLEEVMRLK